MKIFEARFFSNEEVFPNEVFQYCETKKRRRISWCPPRFLFRTLFDLKKFLKHNSVPLRNVSVLWDFSGEKNFQRTVMIHLALLCPKNFDINNFLKHKRVPLRNASVLWAKKTDEDPDAHPLSFFWGFSVSKVFWNTEGFLYKTFRYCETNNIEAQWWCPPPFLSLTFFDIKMFL